MSISNDIMRTYVRPAEVIRRRMGHEPREDRAVAILLGACVLILSPNGRGWRGKRISTTRWRFRL